MSPLITTQTGQAFVREGPHSITFHLDKMADINRFASGDFPWLMTFSSFYHRILPRQTVRQLGGMITQRLGLQGHMSVIFLAPETVAACQEFITSPKRGEKVLTKDDTKVFVFDIGGVYLYLMFFTPDKAFNIVGFARNSGETISSRLAEYCLSKIDTLRQVEGIDFAAPANVPRYPDTEAHSQIRKRLAALSERAPACVHTAPVNPEEDVYLFQSGMSSIYAVHKYISENYEGSAVLFGFAFGSTIDIFIEFYKDQPNKILGLGNEEDLIALEKYCEEEQTAGRRVASVWTEFYCNPTAMTPNLTRLRELADKFGFILIADDTLASVCNVDLLGRDGADIVVTSLTKSFNGYADLMSGSAIINPSVPKCSELRKLFKQKYQSIIYEADAAALEKNSQDYLARSAKHNTNTFGMLEYFHKKSQEPGSFVKKVQHTLYDPPSLKEYQKRMRKPTTEDRLTELDTTGDSGIAFTPGYGTLFGVDLGSDEVVDAFYDNMNLHKGPHLGAPRTLMVPYIKIAYSPALKDEDHGYSWAAKYGMFKTFMRFAPGLENLDDLIEDLEAAYKATQKALEEKKAN